MIMTVRVRCSDQCRRTASPRQPGFLCAEKHLVFAYLVLLNCTGPGYYHNQQRNGVFSLLE
jgi:hypothetical protein